MLLKGCPTFPNTQDCLLTCYFSGYLLLNDSSHVVFISVFMFQPSDEHIHLRHKQAPTAFYLYIFASPSLILNSIMNPVSLLNLFILQQKGRYVFFYGLRKKKQKNSASVLLHFATSELT